MWLNGRRLAGRLTWTEPLVAVVLRAAVVLAVTLEPRRDAAQVVAQEEPRVAAVVHRCSTKHRATCAVKAGNS